MVVKDEITHLLLALTIHDKCMTFVKKRPLLTPGIPKSLMRTSLSLFVYSFF